MSKFFLKISLIISLSQLNVGCAMLGPNYQPVTPDTPSTWNSNMAAGLDDNRLSIESLSHWWTLLKDPLLDDLEQQAVKGNLDLKAAKSRLREARSLRNISHNSLSPIINTSASASKNRTIISSENDLFAAGFDTIWELDIFGGNRRAMEAADAKLSAIHENLRDIMVSLTAEIGLNYIDVRTFQARLAAATNDLTAQQQTHDLNKSRYRAGLINQLAVQQSRYNLERTRSHIPQLETGLLAAMNRLAILLGTKPGSLTGILSAAKPIPPVPATVTIGLPAEAMRRRPDIRQAERELAAQTARIGEATADLYPKFRLTGSIGLESLDLENLPEWASRIFHIGPSVSWNIFDAGTIRQNIEIQTARQEQAIIHYQATVLGALEDVENSLIAFIQEKDRNLALTDGTNAARLAVIVAKDRYEAGISDFSDILDAQRTLHSFQDELAQSTGTVTANLIRIYKALGGGWHNNINKNSSRSKID